MPRSRSASTTPNGTFHATSPVFTFTATSSPNGGAEQGTFVSGFQNRPTGPPKGELRQPGELSRPILALLHAGHLADVHDVREQQSPGRVVGEAVPVAATKGTREGQHRAVRARWREDALRVHLVLVPELLAVGGVLRCERVEVLCRIERGPAERGRLQRKRLGGPRLLAGHVARRHRPFLHPEQRFARHAVEDEQQRHLREHRDGRNGLAVPLHVDEHRSGRQIEIPEIVVDQLLVPQELAGPGVERDDRVAVEVLPLAIATVIVGRRRAERRVDDAAFGVDREEGPHVRAGSVLPAVAFPGLHAWLPRSRHRMELPEQAPRLRVPPSNVAVEPEAGRLLTVVSAGDDDVLEDRGRRDQADAPVHLAHDAALEVGVSAISESGRELPGLRIQRNQVLARAGDDPGAGRAVTGPVRRRRGGLQDRAPRTSTAPWPSPARGPRCSCRQPRTSRRRPPPV